MSRSGSEERPRKVAERSIVVYRPGLTTAKDAIGVLLVRGDRQRAALTSTSAKIGRGSRRGHGANSG